MQRGWLNNAPNSASNLPIEGGHPNFTARSVKTEVLLLSECRRSDVAEVNGVRRRRNIEFVFQRLA
jgi:hypothetical protein